MDGKQIFQTPDEDVNYNVTPGMVIRDLHVPCVNSKLNEHFKDNITSLAFHKEISLVNLAYILNRCTSLEILHLDNVKLIYPENKKSEKNSTRKLQLKRLKQMKLSFINQNEGILNLKPASLHSETLNLLNFIEGITYGSLEDVDITCSLDQLIAIPFPAAFVPNYTLQKPDSLVEFLYNNRCTLRQLTIGPKENEKLFIEFKLVDQDDQICTEKGELQVDKDIDHTFHRMSEFPNREPTLFEKFITADQHPLPEWWTCMLEHQSALGHLSLTLMDSEVLDVALKAAERCNDTLSEIHFRIIGKDLDIDLGKLNRCTKVNTVSLIVSECHVQVINMHLLPESIKILQISGLLCEKYSVAIVKSLPYVKELTVYLNKFDYPDKEKFSVFAWPVFENLMDFHHLESFIIEAEHMKLDWDEIHEWSTHTDWCIDITHNILEEVDREQIFMKILPIGLQQLDSTESDPEINPLCSCLGL